MVITDKIPPMSSEGSPKRRFSLSGEEDTTRGMLTYTGYTAMWRGKGADIHRLHSYVEVGAGIKVLAKEGKQGPMF